MALAILEAATLDKTNGRFQIDTGTNKYYQFKFGRSIRRKNGIDWVDDVFFSTPIKRNASGGELLGSSQDVSVPVPQFEQGSAYVQLFSYKTPQGKSPAFSSVVKLHAGFDIPDDLPLDFASSFSSRSTSMRQIVSFREPRRRVPWRSAKAFSQQASLEDLLASVVKLAAPVVMNLLSGAKNGSQPAAPSPNGGSGQADVVARLLQTILGSLGGVPVSPVTQTQSLSGHSIHANRFLNGHSQFSRPLIFGIDDALLASLAGPVLQALPGLMNAANQKRVQTTQANNKLVTDILSTINQRRLLEQLVEAQKQAPAAQAAGGVDLTQLIQLLQQAPPPGQAAPAQEPPAPVPPPVTPLSLMFSGRSSALSTRAVLAFETAEPLAWNGSTKPLFAKNQQLRLRVKLSVGEPIPKTPLPKAIVKLILKDAYDQHVLLEKTYKQKDVPANTVIALDLSQAEVAALPANRCLSVLAEMRWLSPKTGAEHKALGATEMVLVSKYSLKEQGAEASPERELTDLKQFRPFWNKVWESPSLQAVNARRQNGKRDLWALEVDAKYSVLLSTQGSNGLMETKVLQSAPDEDSLTEKAQGRLKAGIELSLAELNKLMPLWEGATPLPLDKFEALNTEALAKSAAGEFLTHLKLKGKARERGMVWVVPVFKLFDFTLSSVQSTDETGQIVSVSDEKIRFPLPVSARVIGLKSEP